MANIGMREVLHEGASPITVDIVFVHGLNGDRLATWTKDKICWPRDLLKVDMPNSRIMSWGYDANVIKFLDSAGQSSVAALALQLLEDVARRRRTGEEMQRPIVFVVHSLGGLIVKDALTQSYHESRLEFVVKPKIASIKAKTLGVVFAGTPHRGSDKAKWGRIANNIATIVLKDNSSALVTALSRGSETLERLQNEFARVIGSLRIYTFFEDYRYPQIGKIVDNDSASLGFPHEHTQILPGNHSDMIKFSSRDDSGYERISGAILDIVEAGPMEPQRAAKSNRTIYGIAIKAYCGDSELHLTFVEHAVIRNLKFLSKTVWKGTVNGKTGLFPKDCIDIVDQDSPLASPVTRTPAQREPWKRSSVLPNVSSPLANAGKSVNITTVQAEPMKDIIETFRTTTLSTKDPQYRDWLEAFWIACEEGHLAGVEKQVNRGVDINATAGPSDCISQYGTGLTAAVHNNHVEVVRFLLGHGARPNQPGNTKGVCLPLHIAASLGHKLIVKILLSHGANVHAQGGAYRFALTAAAVGGDISIMKLLLDQGADLKAHDMENETALHGAVIGGHLHAVQYLVRRGLDPNVSGHQGTALELAILLEQQNPGFGADIIQYLSGDMIDPTPPMARSPEPQRPKITLDTTSDAADEEVNKEILEILQALLRASLLLSAKDGKYQDVVDLLMPPDPVDPNQLCEHDEQYGYPLHAAAANGHWKVVILLLERGAEVNLQGLQLGTALHFAAYFGHAEVMIMLLAWGAEMNSISNIEGMRATPLELAATMGHTHCMLLLLKFGADVNLSGGTAGSPLHAAASSSNSLATTQLLLSYGANVCIGNSFGMSAADVARAAEQHPTKRLLKQWGCPRAGLLTPQRFLAWAASINVRVEQQQQQQQREQVVQNLIQQYAAGIKSEQVS